MTNPRDPERTAQSPDPSGAAEEDPTDRDTDYPDAPAAAVQNGKQKCNIYINISEMINYIPLAELNMVM